MSAHFFENYPLSLDRYDEMRTSDGSIRPHWEPFVERMEALGPEVLQRRVRFVQNSIEADGVTYHLNTHSTDDRPWEVDALPTVVSPEDWAYLSAAVSQRATLLNRILQDLYGPQNLLSEGFLPPALVFGQPGFSHPCRHALPENQTHLHLYAVDLARSPDGQWWVIGDRTQAPLGAGYALQNRLTISRAFSDAFRSLQVRPLARFFREMQEGLTQQIACQSGEAPLVVLLSPGPYHESYFEHAFLARYLGFPLVEGQDLTVRRDTVYLKTLKGLKRVHAILRRLDDDLCDPLELRANSALGIPGLLQAVRAQRVTVANALGSGVLESSGALFGFLPRIAQSLLGESLLMPSVASWWCGEGPALAYVRDHLDELILKPAFTDMRMPATFGHQLSAGEREEMLARLEAQPHAYVAQEWVHLSKTPVWTGLPDSPVEPRTMGLRLFAVATPTGYSVMPGGLARVASSPSDEILSMQRGGLSKDVWVRASEPFQRTSLIKNRLGVSDLVHAATEIPSRAGENLFWMGRYTERVESCARMLRAGLVRVSSASSDTSSLPTLLSVCEMLGILSPETAVSNTPLSLRTENRLLNAVGNPGQPGSLAASVKNLFFAGNQVKERMSSDNWHAINRMAQILQPAPTTSDQAIVAIDKVMLSAISMSGFAMDDMTRDEGWRFLVIGRRVERLAFLSALIRQVLLAETHQRARMYEWLLEVANSIVTYRARYRRGPELLPVLYLLVFDLTNPHAVAFQLNVLQRYVRRTATDLAQPPTPLLDEISEKLALYDLTVFESEEDVQACQNLANLLQKIEQSAYALSEYIHQHYFNHTAEHIQPQWIAS